MFTGIVQGKATVHQITQKANLMTVIFEFPPQALHNLTEGASIAINGTCLTVTYHDGNFARFDIIDETLRVTNLGQLTVGQSVNYERAARFGDEIGGDILSGHIHTVAELVDVHKTETNTRLNFKVPEQWIKYILPKGFVALNGCSLTVGADVDNGEFCVHLIPETLEVTIFGQATVGERINLEVDSQTQTIVDTIERMGLTIKNS